MCDAESLVVYFFSAGFALDFLVEDGWTAGGGFF